MHVHPHTTYIRTQNLTKANKNMKQVDVRSDAAHLTCGPHWTQKSYMFHLVSDVINLLPLCRGHVNFLQARALTWWSAIKTPSQHARASIFKRAPLSFSLTGSLGTLRSSTDLRYPHLNQRTACPRLALIASFVSEPGLPWISTSVFYLNFI